MCLWLLVQPPFHLTNLGPNVDGEGGLEVMELVVVVAAVVVATVVVALCVVLDLIVALSLSFGVVLAVAVVRIVLDLGVDGLNLGPAVVGLCAVDDVEGPGVVPVVVVDLFVDEVTVVVELSSVLLVVVVVDVDCCLGLILSLFLRRRSLISPGTRALPLAESDPVEARIRPDGIWILWSMAGTLLGVVVELLRGVVVGFRVVAAGLRTLVSC